MKKISQLAALTLSMISAVTFANGSSKDQDVDNETSLIKVSGSYSPWFVNWEQTSTAASRFGADAIVVDYAIDGAIAHSAQLNLEVMGVDFDFQLVELPEGSEDAAQSISQLNFGLQYTDFVGETSLHYMYSTAEFEGMIYGSDNGGRTGTGAFTTETLSHDISLLTKWGLGIGYRAFSYDLPQDVYLVKDSSPSEPIFSGFSNIEYQADFYQLVFAKDNILGSKPGQFDIGVTARYGFGVMEAGGEFIEGIENDPEVNSEIIGDADATFIEYELFGYMNLLQQSDYSADVKFGYRFSKMTAEFDAGEDYSLVTDFETSFGGPYVSFQFKY